MMQQPNIEAIMKWLESQGYEVKATKPEEKPKEEVKIREAEQIGDELVVYAPESEFIAELPLGTHRAFVCDKPRVVEAKTGKKQIAFPFELYEPYAGRRGIQFIPIPEGLWQLRRTLDALKVKYTRKGDLISFIPEEVVGAECRVVVAKHTYGGLTRHRITSVLPLEEEEEPID